MAEQKIIVADLMSRLQDEFGYPPAGARLVADKLAASAPAIKAAFLRWWQGKPLDVQLEIQGYTLERLADEHGMKPIAAFLTLDWLEREPRVALSSLARGHDRIES